MNIGSFKQVIFHTKKDHKELIAQTITDELKKFLELVQYAYQREWQTIIPTFVCWLQYIKRSYLSLHEQGINCSDQLAVEVDLLPDDLIKRLVLMEGSLIPAVLKTFLRDLAIFYLKTNDRQEMIVREFFFNAINPLEYLVRSAAKILKGVEELTLTQEALPGISPTFPPEINDQIFSHLDERSLYAIKRTCKAGYRFFHKHYHPEEQFLYVVTNETVSALTDNSADALVASLNKSTSQTMQVNAFHSLYHALESIESYQQVQDINLLVAPTLWVVQCHIPITELTFRLQTGVLHKNSLNRNTFSFNQRELAGSYALLAERDFKPILGVHIRSESKFAEYTVSNIVNMLTYKPDSNLSKNPNCKVM